MLRLTLNSATLFEQGFFKRSYRAHAHRDDELGASGSGLGLFIAQGCVIALRGTLAVESTPGAGTTFTISLPPARNDAAAAVQSAALN